jgi:5'-nucleotidase
MASDLRLLCVNDVYKPERLSKLKVLAKQHKGSGVTKLVLPGDFLGGSVFAAKHQGESVLEILNELDVDYFTLGNHEFDFGAEKVIELMDKSNFTWLGSNVRHAQNGDLFHNTKDVDIFDVDTATAGRVRVGVFGVCTQATPSLADPGDSVVFEDSIKHAKRCTKLLKDVGCEMVVALTHVDLVTDKRIADVPGVDLIIGGHEHTPYVLMHAETLIIKCGQNVDHLGIVDVFFERDKQKKLTWTPSFNLLSTRTTETDATIDAIISKWNSVVDPNDEALTCVHDVPLSTLTADCRGRETAFPCYVADAMKYSYRAEGCQLALLNGGFIRADNIYPPGTVIHKSDLLTEMPFERRPLLMKVRGKDIKLGLEQMISKSPEPAGSFPHLSDEWVVEYDTNQAPLSRIVSMKYQGRPVDMSAEYRIAIQSFYVEKDGDGVTAFNDKDIVADHEKLVSACAVEYFKTLEHINGAPPKRLVNLALSSTATAVAGFSPKKPANPTRGADDSREEERAENKKKEKDTKNNESANSMRYPKTVPVFVTILVLLVAVLPVGIFLHFYAEPQLPRSQRTYKRKGSIL